MILKQFLNILKKEKMTLKVHKTELIFQGKQGLFSIELISPRLNLLKIDHNYYQLKGVDLKEMVINLHNDLQKKQKTTLKKTSLSSYVIKEAYAFLPLLFLGEVATIAASSWYLAGSYYESYAQKESQKKISDLTDRYDKALHQYQEDKEALEKSPPQKSQPLSSSTIDLLKKLYETLPRRKLNKKSYIPLLERISSSVPSGRNLNQYASRVFKSFRSFH